MTATPCPHCGATDTRLGITRDRQGRETDPSRRFVYCWQCRRAGAKRDIWWLWECEQVQPRQLRMAI